MGDLWKAVQGMATLVSSPPDTCSGVALSSGDGAESTWIAGDQVFILSLCLVILVVVGFAYSSIRYYRRKYEARDAHLGFSKTRFRKRDRFMFYGRKVLRQVTSAAGSNRRKKIITKITKKLLKLKTDTPPTRLHVLEPAAEYLQEEIGYNKADQRLPPEVTYMLKSIRMFGIFERPLFLELCKHVETIHVTAGQYLFRIGDADENFYVVQSGVLNVFITEPDGSTLTLKVVKEGDSIASLLSFTDVLTGHPQPFKTVSAQALENSSILKLPVDAFREVFEKNPETFVRVIQIIMVRLNRVTFTALHQHLGLSHELVQAPRRRSMAFQVSPLRRSTGYVPSSIEDNTQTPDLLDSDAGAFVHATQANHNLLGAEPIAVPSQTLHSSLRRRHNMGMTPPTGYHPSGTSSVGEGDGSQPIMSEFFVPSTESDDDSAFLLKQAVNAFKLSLGLEDIDTIKDLVNLKDIPAGAFLAKEESNQGDCGLVYVVSGLLTLTQRENEKDVVMFNAHPGEFVGALAVLTGEPSIFTIKAKQHTRLAVMTSAAFYSIMATNPKVVLHLANIVVRRLSPFVRQIDFAMDWIFLEGGRALYRQGDESDCTFIVLSGRLRSVITRNDGKKQLVGEYGRGDLVGVVETLTRTKRMSTVMAVRDTELAKLPEGLLNAIKLKYPIVMSRLIQLLGHRILGSWQQPMTMNNVPNSSKYESKPSHVNFSTVAVLPVTEDVPLSAFTYELIHSLTSIGSSLRLTSDYIKTIMGSSIMDAANEYKLTNWLAQQEDKHRLVLYQCDYSMTVWTQRCIRQADCILIVGMGANQPSVGKVEKQLEHLAFRIQKELVLLHKEGSRPKNTASWLNIRTWCSSHHHLQCPKRMFSKKAKNTEYYETIMQQEVNIHSDFSRLARWLTGTSVGLVLGGGGARGAAHVGMLKAIQEAGIPIDMVGGVSIGSLMSGLYSMERNIVTVTQKAREWSRKMTQWWRQAMDLTYPVTSMFSGAGFNKTLYDVFGDAQIEDLWLPYFNITTDITASEMRVHTHGSLWRYVRASMSLAAYLPPLCDPMDGHLLLDGGYICNLPSDVMRAQGARYILAVDVGSQDETDFTNYGDSLSGWWLLWQKWTTPFRSVPVKVPNLPDIQSRLAYVSCVRQLEEVRNSDYCTYIRPPIDRYKTLQFGSFDEIKDVGYQHGSTFFQGLKMGGAMLPMTSSFGSQTQYLQKVAMVQKRKAERPAFNNFTDLAQMVCKVRNLHYGVNSDDDDSYEDDDDYGQYGGYASEHSLDFPCANAMQKTASDPAISSSFVPPYEGDIDM
ncbi:neuropathy target esterase sws-like isoform X1 [Folsomia candida]|uniref:neuropathy target esterase sws-like isoform X1 n=2 Tax=Folsomia candida TaxID=158441 RepID=UPI00160541EA|nr:neuropathy target esterase sws-like isoform X1 [Folsomia candida]